MTSTRTAELTLPSDKQIRIVREFDAPRELVWEAYTTPELVRRWWHARRGEVTSIAIDLRVGGSWRYAMTTTEGGFEVAFHGEYRELVPHERIVSTEVYEGGAGGTESEALNIVTFTEADGHTTLEILMQLDSRETRDAVLATGMEDGLQDALDLLEQTAAGLR